MMDIAEELVAPILEKPQEITRDSLVLGYAGVYSSFLLHAQKAAQQFGIDSRSILVELGQTTSSWGTRRYDHGCGGGACKAKN